MHIKKHANIAEAAKIIGWFVRLFAIFILIGSLYGVEVVFCDFRLKIKRDQLVLALGRVRFYLSRLTHRAIAVGRKWNERPILEPPGN